MTIHPDVAPDASLRQRLWFRFWRGWRMAMIALVVLVAVAWGTRPGWTDQAVAYRMSRFGDDSVYLIPRRTSMQFRDYYVLTMLSWPNTVQTGPMSLRITSWGRTIGAFGCVCVLD